MILETPTLAALVGFGAETIVIGSGSVGVATALRLAAGGQKVLILESGGLGVEPGAEDLARAEGYDPESHFEPHTAVARRLGGTSNLWAGRCLPFDAIDFQARHWLGLASWPIEPKVLAPYLAPALDALGAGGPMLRAGIDGIEADPAFRFDRLERWTNEPRIQKRHHQALALRESPMIALHATVLGFRYNDDGRIVGIELDLDGARGELPVGGGIVLAAGGNASTRLLLLEQDRVPGRYGGAGGPLGRFYMGHLSGGVADVVFHDRRLHDGLDYYVDRHGSYVRRRIWPAEATQEAEELANVAFWPVVPRIAQAEHRSGPLSAVFLALSLGSVSKRLIAEPVRLKHLGQPPWRWGPHLRNVLLDLLRTMSFVPSFLWRHKVAKMRLPGFFLQNRAMRYGLEYHAEQLPDPSSRLILGESRDALGQRRLRIDLRFSERDAELVLKAHDALGAWLDRNGLARLEYHHEDREDRAAAVLESAKDGAHQVGTIRMGEREGEAVVDGNCRAFGVPNLFVVSTAVLPTSGQANPTLTAVQLGLRLADGILTGSL